MVDKLQESLQFYQEMSKTEEQSSEKTGDSDKAKDSSKDENRKEDHSTQVRRYASKSWQSNEIYTTDACIQLTLSPSEPPYGGLA